MTFLFAVPQSLPAGGPEIPPAENLQVTGGMSRQMKVPTIVFVSRDACPYCRTLHDKILDPMMRADKFKQKAILIEVSLDRVEPLTGFDGQPMTAQAFGDLYGAEITPTLLFLDAEGHEISRRLIGISNLELYGFYLQESIDQALLSLRGDMPAD
jgi:hypothetical protein